MTNDYGFCRYSPGKFTWARRLESFMLWRCIRRLNLILKTNCRSLIARWQFGFCFVVVVVAAEQIENVSLLCIRECRLRPSAFRRNKMKIRKFDCCAVKMLLRWLLLVLFLISRLSHLLLICHFFCFRFHFRFIWGEGAGLHRPNCDKLLLFVMLIYCFLFIVLVMACSIRCN